MAVKPIPEGYHNVTPYLVVQAVPRLIEFTTRAFEGKEVLRMTEPGGGVRHAEVKIGDSIVMMGEASAQHPAMPTSLYLYVTDTDTAYKRALQAGATSLEEPATQFYRDRRAGVKDPVGNHWWIATHVEDVPPEEMKRRAAAATRG